MVHKLQFSRKIRLSFFLLACGAVLSATAAFGAAQSVRPGSSRDGIDRLVRHGGFLVRKEGRIIAERRAHEQFIPASILKIVTALGAIDLLGDDFRFETRFYLDKAGNLYIRGFGDPFLISEEVGLIMERLQALGVTCINSIVLDEGSFKLENEVDGSGKSLNPYDVANGALVVNFNTVNITVADDGAVRSAEPQTPTLPLMQELGSRLPPGTHRINITTDRRNMLRYVGELFEAYGKIQHIPGRGAVRTGKVPQGLAPLYVHRSTKNMDDIIEGLLLYSNNFIANQLFLACGAKRYGYPATWEKGRQAFREFLLTKFHLGADAIRMEEGSGLSRRNRVTPAALDRILEEFKPHADLLRHEHGRLIKSGTLTGVYSYAGYFRNGDNLDSFVLILNQSKNYRDRLLDELEKQYRRSH